MAWITRVNTVTIVLTYISDFILLYVYFFSFTSYREFEWKPNPDAQQVYKPYISWYNLLHVTVADLNDFLQLSDTPDKWWTAYSAKFEVLV